MEGVTYTLYTDLLRPLALRPLKHTTAVTEQQKLADSVELESWRLYAGRLSVTPDFREGVAPGRAHVNPQGHESNAYEPRPAGPYQVLHTVFIMRYIVTLELIVRHTKMPLLAIAEWKKSRRYPGLGINCNCPLRVLYAYCNWVSFIVPYLKDKSDQRM